MIDEKRIESLKAENEILKRRVAGLESAEKELELARLDAVKASEAKSEFLANMSHEIRTPVHGIIGMTELGMETELDEDQRHIFDTIHAESSALLEIINEILDFSKIEAGRIELERISFNLKYLLEDFSEGMRLRARQKGLDFFCRCAPGVPEALIGDPGRLRQILVNLAANALKFTERGEILITVEPAEQDENGIRLLFKVKDSGIGIPEDKQPSIFESFTQVDGSTSRRYGGTGLGTTISKRFVEMMDGEIGLESEPGKGSTFWFTALFGKQADRVEENRGDVDFSKTNALLVDGNGATRRTVREDLLSWGCSPEEAKSGREALERLESRRRGDDKCFLVITDMRLPDMSGFDLARKVREMDEYSQIPIVLLTSMGTRGDAKLCREIGIQAYLTRPLDPGDLYRAVNAVLSRPVVNGSDSRLVTRHTIAEEGIKGAIVLVAEDNPTNRQVVERHLSSAGYHVNLAEDGRKAVELYGERQYDLVLMDVQMPEMDGYEASRAIREIEARLAASAGAGGLPRTPLIAVTAHATKEHRERCFACGMDDYVCKPLKRRELLQVVEKWLKNDQEPVLAPAQERDCKCDKPIDYDKALDEFEGDEEFLSEVVAGFLDNLKLQARAIRKAIEARDAETVQREGHSIKGGAGNLAAEPLSHIGYELEMIGKSGELPAGKDALDRLELEAGRLETYLRQRVN